MIKKVLPAFLSVLVLVALIEGAVRWEWVNASLIPAPSTLISTFLQLRSDFQTAFLETFMNVLVGWGLSIFLGTLSAFFFSLFDLLRKAILPFAIFFQTVPIIAVAPLLVIYFGFGAPTVIASSFIVSLFPIIANTLLGLQSPKAGLLELFHVYRASRLQTLLKLRLPSAFTFIYAGLKISAGLAIVGAIAGEFVGGGGLGALIDSARTQQRVDIVFCALGLLALMGLSLLGTLALGHRLLNLRRPWGPLDS